MTSPLLGQRSRGELVAELYDRHAAGLYAYSHDQLGDADSAFDILVTVLAGVTAAGPPRAALYALARREIFLRDIVYSPPPTGLDPAAALVERVLSELRTHQREVLYLSGVCEMDATELSWVLDVAVDTADELTVSACRRFAQSLGAALASARIPEHMTEVFGALAVAPVRDVLNLAPWATLPPGLRAAVLGPRTPVVPAARRATSPLVRQLWPISSDWPLPLADTVETAFPPPDDSFPDPFSPRDPETVSAHEASTEPMPKLGDSVLTALDTAALRPRRRLQRPRPRRAMPLSAPTPGDVLDDAPGRQDLFRPLPPAARAARVHVDRLVAAAPRPAAEPAPAETPQAPPAGIPRIVGDVLDDTADARPLPGWPLQTDQLDALAEREQLASAPSPHATPKRPPLTERTAERAQPFPAAGPKEPGPEAGGVRPPLPSRPVPVEDAVQPPRVNWFADSSSSGDTRADEAPADRAPLRLPRWIMREDQQDAPLPVPDPALTSYEAQWSESVPPEPVRTEGERTTELSLSGRTGSRTRARRQARRARRAARAGRYDWAWEVIGFVIALAIAMIVFFAMPMIGTP